MVSNRVDWKLLVTLSLGLVLLRRIRKEIVNEIRSFMVKDYKELRRRYNIPAIVLLVILALPFLYIVQVTQK